MITDLKAPFPYFGGKSTVAPIIWEALFANRGKGNSQGEVNRHKEALFFSPYCHSSGLKRFENLGISSDEKVEA